MTVGNRLSTHGLKVSPHLTILFKNHFSKCLKCGKRINAQSEKEKEIKDKLYRKFCRNGKIMTSANNS